MNRDKMTLQLRRCIGHLQFREVTVVDKVSTEF